MNDGYIRSLDGIRALAILLVMTFHAELTQFGWTGVQLFFVLSGFLITGILWKEKSREGDLAHKFKKFWVRRSLRIFPLYFGYLLFLGLSYLFLHFPAYYATYIPWLATYTFNYTRTMGQWQGNPLFTHLWSLSIEEQFYLFFPLIVLLCPRRFTRWFMVVMAVAAPLVRYGLGIYYSHRGFAPEVTGDAVYWNTLTHLDAFFLGGLIPVWGLDKSIRRPGRLFLLAAIITLGAGAIDFALTGSGPYLADLGYRHAQTFNYEHVWQYTCLNLLFSTLILNLVSIHNQHRLQLFRRILEHRWLVRIGRVSYGMYVFHWAILVYFYARFFTSPHLFWRIVLFVPYVLLVYLFAEASYRFYEVHFLKLKERIGVAKTPTPPTPPAHPN
jgi:peptidoglycan/LPS O-acetylase OafA/YrhL